MLNDCLEFKQKDMVDSEKQNGELTNLDPSVKVNSISVRHCSHIF